MATARSEYQQAHAYVVDAHGPASHSPCKFCGAFAAEWAYDHADPNEIYRDGYLWSENTAHYIPLCRRDHRAFDRAFRKYGKEHLPAVIAALTEAGEARYPEGQREATYELGYSLWRSREIALGNIPAGS